MAHNKEACALSTSLPHIDALFAEWNRPDSPGAALAIVDQGEVVYKQGYGCANLEYGIPITPATIFHVASVSKQFTAIAVALLAEEGTLSLDDQIQTHVPELPRFSHPITLRHLIHHTSGLRDQWELLRLAGWRMDDVITWEQILRLVVRQRDLNFAPGSEYLYCNTGYTLLAEVILRVRGQSLRQFADARFFQPLGMNSTLFFDDHEEIVPGRAYSYKPGGDGGFKKSVLNYANVGATSLFTTVEDLARWLLHFEAPAYGSPAFWQRVHQPYTLTGGERTAYACGLMLKSHRGVPFVGHGGADAGYRTVTARFPEQRLGIVILSNLSTFLPEAMARKVAEAYLGARVQWGPEEPAPNTQPEPESVAVSAEQLASYTGAYYSDELDITYHVSAAEGELLVTARRREDLRFRPIGPDAFRETKMGMLTLAFVREGDTIVGLKVDGGRVRHVRFVRAG